MRTYPTISGRGLTAFAGSDGLPKAIRGKPLFTPRAGSANGLRAGVDALSRQSRPLGAVLEPGEPLIQGIGRAVGQTGYGGRLYVPEGVWDFAANGLVISANGLEIVALSPGKTTFRRADGASAGVLVTYSGTSVYYGVLTITGTLVTVRGINFEDATGTAEAVTVRGSFATIDGCRFTDVYRAVSVCESAATRVTNNLIVQNRATDNTIRTFESCTRLLIAGNVDQSGGGRDIALGASTTDSVVTGNVLDSDGKITFTGGTSKNKHAGNVADVNEEGSYTLADNTAAATDVPGFPTWDTTLYRSVHMRYQITRGATPDAEAGDLVVLMNASECVASVPAVPITTTTPPGVTLSGAVSAGTARLQYTTTSTGQSATLRILSVTYGSA